MPDEAAGEAFLELLLEELPPVLGPELPPLLLGWTLLLFRLLLRPLLLLRVRLWPLPLESGTSKSSSPLSLPSPSLLLMLELCLTRWRSVLGITSSERWTLKAFLLSFFPNPIFRFRPELSHTRRSRRLSSKDPTAQIPPMPPYFLPLGPTNKKMAFHGLNTDL